MELLRRYWTSILILFAVVASFLVSRADTRTRDRDITSALVIACSADSQRTALNAAGYSTLARRVLKRAQRLDAESSRKYRAVATGIVTLIPAPIGVEGTPAIAEVVLVDRPGLEPRLVITKRARALQLQGCKDFYGVG